MSYTTDVLYASDFDDVLLDRAFSIYQMCYSPTEKAVFESDFRAKTFAVLIRKNGSLVGFSTAEVLTIASGARVIFSGDTVTHPEHRGTQALPAAWLHHSGKIWAEAPDVPLFWMLITKGHRTFRYLPAFSREYQPSPDWQMDPSSKAIMDELAFSKFGGRYDPHSGIIEADEALPTRVSEAVTARSNNRYAVFFERCNPGFDQGDELVTLCQLAPDKLTPRARSWFISAAESA